MFSKAADFIFLVHLCVHLWIVIRSYLAEFRGKVPKISRIMILNKQSTINPEEVIAVMLKLKYAGIDSEPDDIIKTAR